MAEIKYPKTDLVSCRFYVTGRTDLFSEKAYVFQALPGLRLAAGDTVVVSCATGLQVARVVAMNATLPKNIKATAHIISKVDLEGYLDMLAKEAEMIRIKQALESRRKEVEQRQIYDMIAERDDETRVLLERFYRIGGEF